MCQRGSMKLVETPTWLWLERTNPAAGIAIDSCIADTIVEAWKNGVRTLGSCCGHYKELPNVVLTSDLEQIKIAQQFLPNFTLYQWELVDVTRR